jgi:hypothetical protein
MGRLPGPFWHNRTRPKADWVLQATSLAHWYRQVARFHQIHQEHIQMVKHCTYKEWKCQTIVLLKFKLIPDAINPHNGMAEAHN